MNAVTPIESVRIRAVIEDALEKLSFLTIITPDVMGHSGEMAALVGDEISQTIKSQRDLEAKYDALVKRAAQLKGHMNKAELLQVQAQIRAVSGELRDTMRGLCRNLKENPDVGDNLAKLAEERDAIVALLEAAYNDLHEGHFHSLAEHVRKETQGREKVSAVAQKEETTTKEVARLSSSLKNEEDKHTVEVEAKKQEIAALKEKLRKLKQDTSSTIRYARKELTARIDSNSKLYSAQERSLAQQIEQVQTKIDAEAEAHEASMELLRREQDELTKSAESWKARHASEVASKAQDLKALTAERDAQRMELHALQIRYEKDLQIMMDKAAEAERTAFERAVAKEKAAAERKAAKELIKVLGPMFLTILGAKKLAEEEKNKGKKKKK